MDQLEDPPPAAWCSGATEVVAAMLLGIDWFPDGLRLCLLRFFFFELEEETLVDDDDLFISGLELEN